jgi:hypothetical protein
VRILAKLMRTEARVRVQMKGMSLTRWHMWAQAAEWLEEQNENQEVIDVIAEAMREVNMKGHPNAGWEENEHKELWRGRARTLLTEIQKATERREA